MRTYEYSIVLPSEVNLKVTKVLSKNHLKVNEGLSAGIILNVSKKGNFPQVVFPLSLS